MISPPQFAIPMVAALCLAAAPEALASGSHDFDFNLGTWKSHIRRVLHPLSNSNESIQLEGTVTVRKIWDGAQLEEIEADGPNGHWEGLTLFLFNPQTGQWSQSFANSRNAVLGAPNVGGFKNGRGELVSSDTVDGRLILVRSTWSELKPDSHRYEEHDSDDGGRTWHLAFEADLTRTTSHPVAMAADRRHDFDFELGRWKTHSRRLLHPLSGSHEWVDREGDTDIAPVWGGKGNLVHLELDGPTGHTELAGLRIYNPEARQWRFHFATPAGGGSSPPMVGEFHDGRGAFYDQEEFNGRMIWVRITIVPTSPNSVVSEQAFSDDQGKTWETNLVNTSTRVDPPSAPSAATRKM